MSESIYYIYKITNTINGKMYIGFTNNTESRLIQHRSASKKGKTLLYKAIRKYGWQTFKCDVLYCSKDRNHTLMEMENYFIKMYRSFYKTGCGYNMTMGGEGTVGLLVSESLKGKLDHRGIKNSMYGRRHKPESLALMRVNRKNKRAWNTGVPCSEIQKQKNSVKLKGRVPWNKGRSCPHESPSLDTRLKRSLSLKQYWTDVKEGRVIRGHAVNSLCIPPP